MEDGPGRRVYLPPGAWVDYQAGRSYAGGRWHRIDAGSIPIVLLVRDHSVIPRVAVAQSTAQIDWKNVELRVFSSDGAPVNGRFALPDGPLQTIRLAARGASYSLAGDPLGGAVRWRITRAASAPVE